jgi:hypothetical protein
MSAETGLNLEGSVRSRGRSSDGRERRLDGANVSPQQLRSAIAGNEIVVGEFFSHRAGIA